MNHENSANREYDPVYLNSLRETFVILIAWVGFCLWVVGYCAWRGYDVEVEQMQLVLGMPAWVFWGIAMPWAAANIFSIWFCLQYMADDPLEDNEGGKAQEGIDRENGQ